ncbi:MAG: 2-C-methyl-D-erythritol 4-phosphate cytidylyltransferase [Bacteroidetes bacterium]|nr:2-C-methyl-D-erythritol 4-phosphate cytidylyltransferase [Bacteroidota bacterium]MCW5895402.1 2-C-methyl-D-erythritol 4-phosphate cytidylyltransferase [Bacteroidota bacterium]
MARRKTLRVGVVIPAGGSGRRMGSDIPKQFMLLAGKPVLYHSVRVFDFHPLIDEIVVVVPDNQVMVAERLVTNARFKKVSHVVVGGTERQFSVRNGLLAFVEEPDIVLVHDAVRPLVSRDVITNVIDASRKYKAAVVGVPVKDTIKVETDGFYKKTLDRSRLWAVQTPQGFRYKILMRAHLAAQRNAFLGTDESSLVERLKIPVKVVPGDPDNIKITTKGDLKFAEFLL